MHESALVCTVCFLSRVASIFIVYMDVLAHMYGPVTALTPKTFKLPHSPFRPRVTKKAQVGILALPEATLNGPRFLAWHYPATCSRAPAFVKLIEVLDTLEADPAPSIMMEVCRNPVM